MPRISYCQNSGEITLELYTDAVLTWAVPEHRLKRGDIVKLIDHHVAPDDTEDYSIEVFNAVGDTIAVTAVPNSALEPLREDEILRALNEWLGVKMHEQPTGLPSRPPVCRRNSSIKRSSATEPDTRRPSSERFFEYR